jgi:hypothetical protein
MAEPERISLSREELRALLSCVEEYPPAMTVSIERHDVVVIAKWTWRPADAGSVEGGHGGGPIEVVIYRGEKVAEHVHRVPGAGP